MGYFENRPDVVQIFDDLDKLRAFCRFEGYRFDERDLYNKKSRAWQAFLDPEKARKARQARSRQRRHKHNNRKS